MPNIVLAIINPQVLQILGLLRGVLKPSEEDDVVFVIYQSVTTSCWRTFTFTFQSDPLPSRRIQSPKIIVVIESSLLGRRKFTTEKIDPTRIASPTPGMSTSWKGSIRTCDLSPFVSVKVIYEKIVEECG